MMIYDYKQYLLKLKEEIESKTAGTKISTVFSGEWSVLKVIEKYSPEGEFFVWDMLDNDSSILLMAHHTHDSFLISKAYQLDLSIAKIAKEVCIPESAIQSAIKWWNMCFYRNNEGIVLYDDFYPQLYASSDTESRMKDFCDCLQKHLEIIPNDISGHDVYLLGEFATINPFIYFLQKKGCQVIPNTSDIIQESPGAEESLLKLREKIVRPICNNEVYLTTLVTTDGVIQVPAKCGQGYVISLPCDDLDLEAECFGNHSLREILPNGEIRRDYRCCGNEYMYLKQAFYADLFGNTFLKSLNSDSVDANNPKTIILNEFAFNN